ncbi:MAG: type IV pilus twitching motility protein PilT, partial [Planctomycetota bacterium]
MDEFNAFVKKLVLHNKLAGDDQVELAEDMIEDGQNLARALVDIGALTEAKAAAVGNAWTKKTGKPVPGDDNGSAPAAASPAKASQRPKTARTAGGGGAKRSGGSIGKDVSGFRHLDEYFAYARELGASDLHIVVDNPPQIRQFGSLVNLNRAPFTATETERLLFEILRTDQAEALKEHLSIDFAYTDKTGRYRCCLVRQRNGWDGAFRLVADKVPSFDELGLPEQLRKLTEYHQGLILVTGPNGCGKSSTLAAMIDLVNQTRDDHIITIEDPVEYIFEPKRCHVSQREVGT